MRLRGEVCIGTATFFSFAALVILIFAHVGQINTSTIPKGISMMKLNVSQYGEDLSVALGGDPVLGLYTSNATAPVQERAGLRQLYEFGFYSYCAYVDTAQGTCSNITTPYQLQPFAAFLADMPTNYSGITQNLVSTTDLAHTTFVNNHYLSEFSKAAYFLVLIGTICAALAMFIGIPKHTFAYLVSTMFALFGTALLLIGAVIWTVIIKKAQDINDAHILPTGSITTDRPLGVTVSVGNGLFLLWAACVSLFLSILPYMIRNLPAVAHSEDDQTTNDMLTNY